MNNKPLMLISCPIYNLSGYGLWSTDICKSILRYDKFELAINPQRWGSCPPITITDSTATEEDKLLLSKILRQPLTRKPEVYARISIPNEFDLHGQYNIGFTAGIETTNPSGVFVEGMNRPDLVVVMSEFNKKVFQNVDYTKQYQDGKKEQLKCTKPIEVCHWGANTSIFKKTDEQCDSINEIMNQIPEKFAFLFMGQWTSSNPFGDRKDIGNLIKCFIETFNDRDNQPCLILKVNNCNFSITDRHEVLRKIQFIQDNIPANKQPKIYLIHGELSDKEMNALLNHEKVKVFCTSTHGEGYGKNILDATLSGKIVMAPSWSGHCDFLNPEYANLIDIEIKPVKPECVNEYIIAESQWAYTNYSQLSDKMKTAFDFYPQKWLDRAEKLRLENMEKFSLQAMDKRLWAIFDQYIPKFSVEQPLILPKLKKIVLPSLKKIELPTLT